MNLSRSVTPLANYKRQIGHSRAAAFATLTEAEAVQKHPELKSLYRGWRKSIEFLNELFAEDESIRNRCLTVVKEEIRQRLQAGVYLGVRDVYAASKEIARALQKSGALV